MTDPRVESLIEFIRSHTRRIKYLPAEGGTWGALPRRPRAVLFDVYGTIFISAGEHPGMRRSSGEDLARLIRRHGLNATPSELTASLERAIAEEWASLRSRGIAHPEVQIERLWGKLFPERGEEERKSLAVAYELAVNPVWPMPACRRLLRSLRRRGLVLGIVSNAQFYSPLLFQALLGGGPEELGFSPSVCIYSYEHGMAKPQGTLFELAAGRLERLGIPRTETVMVGNDRENDVIPAARCGFMTVLLSGDRLARGPESPAVARVPPDAVIGRLGDLEALIEGAARPC
jgi:putative hydrolase of the HAD superfamily